MDGDMSEILQKINTALNDPDMSNNLKNILNNISPSNDDTNTTSSSKESNESSENEQKRTSSIPDFDLNTILKIKKIMDSINSEENDARANLLLSLKPYIADHKKEKIDQYIKFLHLAKVFEMFNPLGGDIKKDE